MSHLCWVFVLLVLMVPMSDVSSQNCEPRERSLADLEYAVDALNKAMQLVCEEENESTNCSECSRRKKSIGLIGVALDLVSNAKKSIPICVHVPTEEPSTTTGEPTPEVTTEGIRPMDCQDLQAAGHDESGVYTVWPLLERKAVQVRCDMNTDGGGWTVIQSRGNFVLQENFDRDWLDYKNGFGNLERDFWLGNNHIFALTNQGNYSLRMDMTAVNGESAYALYREFRIEDQKSKYKLHVGGYSGTAGDSMKNSNSEMFSTRDRNNIRMIRPNCAVERKGAFWYVDCARCNPNGLYKPGVNADSSMFYYDFKGYAGLFSMEMKIKRL